MTSGKFLLNKNMRPLVVFDETNKEHRELLKKFMETNSWSHSPYRFELPEEDSQNLAYTMQKRVLMFFLEKEFGNAT